MLFRLRIQHVGPGWGGRDRTSEWRNQNPMIPPAITMAFLNFLTPFSPINGTKEFSKFRMEKQDPTVVREKFSPYPQPPS
jgi:hypothetical protein